MSVASFVLDFLRRIALGLGSVLGMLAIMGLGIPRRIEPFAHDTVTRYRYCNVDP